MKSYLQFVAEASQQHKDQAERYARYAANHKPGTFDHHDALAKHHYHLWKVDGSREERNKSEHHRQKADQLA